MSDKMTNHLHRSSPLTAVPHSLSGSLTGGSPALAFVFDAIRRYAISRVPVLVTGESGTARELTARAIHYASASSSGPFITTACAAMPNGPVSIELFGSEKGMSAKGTRKIGRIEMAAGGTLFLDSINCLPLETQARLLRFLQDGAIERIGGRESVPVATRIIVGTHNALCKAVEDRQFRRDLFERLSGLTLNLPPLEEDGRDIFSIAQFFLHQFAQSTACEKLDLLPAQEQHGLEGSSELASIVEQNFGSISQNLAGTRANVEAALVRATLKRNRYNIKQSAKEMGVSRVTLYRAIQKYGIALERSRPRTMTRDIALACHPYSGSA
jgi:DNA-binding NtrC family response regulator